MVRAAKGFVVGVDVDRQRRLVDRNDNDDTLNKGSYSHIAFAVRYHRHPWR